MSFGKMNTFIDIIESVSVKDSEGFTTKSDNIIASVRAYREGRHGTEKWRNRASFFEATDLSVSRSIPGITINNCNALLFCDDGRFEITSVEDVKGREMYIGSTRQGGEAQWLKLALRCLKNFLMRYHG